MEELRKRWGRCSVHTYGKVESTNVVARMLAESEEPAGTIVLAREQTAGRGRGERRWYSPPGGLYLSMVFRPSGDSLLPLTSVLASLGVVRELDRRFPGIEPRIMWPNDILSDGRKLGGVLPDATSGEKGVRFLVVGVGINVKPLGEGAPRGLARRATSLEDRACHSVDLSQVADAVVTGLERYLQAPPISADATTLDLLDRYDWLKGRRVRVSYPGQRDGIRGLSVGIAPDGALLFRPDRGALRRCTAGSVKVESE